MGGGLSLTSCFRAAHLAAHPALLSVKVIVLWHCHQVSCAPASPAGGGDLLADVLRSATTTLITTCRVQYVYTQPTPLLRARTSESRRLEKASATQAPANFSRKTALDPVHHQTKQGDLSVNSVVFSIFTLLFICLACSCRAKTQRSKSCCSKSLFQTLCSVATTCSCHVAQR